MKSTDTELLAAAPQLLSAFRRGGKEFGAEAINDARAPKAALMDAAGEECLELLDHLVYRLGAQRQAPNPGTEEACIFLLEHLANRFQEYYRVPGERSIQ